MQSTSTFDDIILTSVFCSLFLNFLVWVFNLFCCDDSLVDYIVSLYIYLKRRMFSLHITVLQCLCQLIMYKNYHRKGASAVQLLLFTSTQQWWLQDGRRRTSSSLLEHLYR